MACSMACCARRWLACGAARRLGGGGGGGGVAGMGCRRKRSAAMLRRMLVALGVSSAGAGAGPPPPAPSLGFFLDAMLGGGSGKFSRGTKKKVRAPASKNIISSLPFPPKDAASERFKASARVSQKKKGCAHVVMRRKQKRGHGEPKQRMPRTERPYARQIPPSANGRRKPSASRSLTTTRSTSW
jgi:hypothetical protein